MTDVLLDLPDLPVYQNKLYPDARSAAACARGRLLLAQDAATGVVRNTAFDPDLLVYDDSYQNEQGLSPAFLAHLGDVLDVVERHFEGRTILEVGCGKGSFLGMLRERGHAASGIDPAYEGDDPAIARRLFDRDAGVRGEAVVLRHTLEHVDDPLGFLHQVREANDGGLIYIEVPCLDWILDRRAWFDFFYEHVNYFRLEDFGRLFGRVLEAGRLFGGQYLYVVADLASLRAREGVPAAERVSFPPGLFAGMQSLVREGGARRTVVWGAAAKGVMFCHHATRLGLAVEFAVDINPAKQGGFLAGSGVPVLSPDAANARLRAGDRVFVMNSNYLAEIAGAGRPGILYQPMDLP